MSVIEYNIMYSNPEDPKTSNVTSEIDLVTHWDNRTVEKEILRGQQLRVLKPSSQNLKEREIDISKVKYSKQSRSKQSTSRKRSKKYRTSRSRSPISRHKTSPQRKKINKINKCSVRIMELAFPSKRQCFETWKNNYHVLPADMVERLRQYIMSERPTVQISDAFECFKRCNARKKQKGKYKSTKSRKANERFSNVVSRELNLTDLRNFGAIFGYRIGKKLMHSVNANLNPDLEKISKIISKDITNLLQMDSKDNANLNRKYLNMQKDVSDMITLWVWDVLEEANYKMLEDQLKDFEEEVGPALDVLDDLVDNIVDICEPEPEPDESSTRTSIIEEHPEENVKEEDEGEVLDDFQDVDQDDNQTESEDQDDSLSNDQGEDLNKNLSEAQDDTEYNEDHEFLHESAAVTDATLSRTEDSLSNEIRNSLQEIINIIKINDNEQNDVESKENLDGQDNNEFLDATDQLEIKESSGVVPSALDAKDLGAEGNINQEAAISDNIVTNIDEQSQDQDQLKQGNKNGDLKGNGTIISNIDENADIDTTNIEENLDIASNSENRDNDENQNEERNDLEFESIENVSDFSEDFNDVKDKKVKFSQIHSVNNSSKELNSISIIRSLYKNDNETESSVDNKNDPTIFLEPNKDLLSNADEIWPHEINTLKPSTSVTKSITSLGKIIENDEITSAGLEESIESETQTNYATVINGQEIYTKNNNENIKQKETESKSDNFTDKVQINDDLINEIKDTNSDLVKSQNKQNEDEVFEFEKENEYNTDDTRYITVDSTDQQKHDEVIILESELSNASKILDEIYDITSNSAKDIEITFDLSIKESKYNIFIDEKIVPETKPIQTKDKAIQVDLINKIQTSVVPKITRDRAINTSLIVNSPKKTSNSRSLASFKKQESTVKIYSKPNYKVHPCTAPAWALQGFGESKDTNPTKTKQKINEFEIRKWCRDLQNGYDNLESWNSWINNMCKTVQHLDRTNNENVSVKTNKLKVWTELKKKFDRDVVVWFNKYKQTKNQLEYYNNVENLYQKPRIHVQSKPPALRNCNCSTKMDKIMPRLKNLP